ncbi:hypothetical protein CIB84_007295, partial [Bambusicola thoracicus]
VVILKLQDYPSLSHIVILVPPSAGNKVILKTSFLQILGQIIRFHAGALPVYVVSNILLTYGGQLNTLMSTGQCSEFSLELVRTAKPYKVEPIISIVVFLQGYSVRLDPDPCRTTAIILVCIIEILMNSSTSEVKS